MIRSEYYTLTLMAVLGREQGIKLNTKTIPMLTTVTYLSQFVITCVFIISMRLLQKTLDMSITFSFKRCNCLVSYISFVTSGCIKHFCTIRYLRFVRGSLLRVTKYAPCLKERKRNIQITYNGLPITIDMKKAIISNQFFISKPHHLRT